MISGLGMRPLRYGSQHASWTVPLLVSTMSWLKSPSAPQMAQLRMLGHEPQHGQRRLITCALQRQPGHLRPTQLTRGTADS